MRGSIGKIIALLEVSQLDEGFIRQGGLIKPVGSGTAPHTHTTIKGDLYLFFVETAQGLLKKIGLIIKLFLRFGEDAAVLEASSLWSRDGLIPFEIYERFCAFESLLGLARGWAVVMGEGKLGTEIFIEGKT